MKATLSFLLTLLVAAPAFAQVQGLAGHDAPAAASEPYVIHVTDVINDRPEINAAREAFQKMLQESPEMLFGAAKTAETHQIGETRTFKVYNYVKSESSVVMDEIEFTLKAETDRFYLWVETAELANEHVTDPTVEALRAALQDRTPAGSINPDAGIIVNNETLFGAPPDVDGNGKSDVLLVDVRDGWDGSGGYIGGFVWHADVVAANPGHSSHQYSNARDILYVDTYPGLRNGRTEGIESTAAHEYQHLIHLAYDTGEETFVNEGLSEWASIANGYFDRGVTYLSSASEHNTALFDWRDGDLVLNDYERAGLFTTYLAQRLGAAEMGRLVQAADSRQRPVKGSAGYETILQNHAPSLQLADVLLDFHTANFLNDRTGDENHGYALPLRQSFKAVPSRAFNGKNSTSSKLTALSINPGAVQYLTWTDVSDFELTVDVDGNIAPVLQDYERARIRVRAVLDHLNGPTEIRDLAPGAMPHALSGDFSRVALLLTYIVPSSTNGTKLDIDASWQVLGGGNFTTEEIRYDNGSTVAGTFFSLKTRSYGAVATRFDVPDGDTRLARIELAPFYLSQFSNGDQPETAPRDVTVKVWAAAEDGTPGEELVSFAQTDPRAYQGVTDNALNFFEVNLSDYADQLGGLPETIFIGYAEAGTDGNYLVAGVSRYAADNVSFLWKSSTNTWSQLWAEQFGDTPDPVKGTAIPVRAHFITTMPVSTEEAGELPATATLEQNYPNPFNPTTAIRFSLPQSGPVRLAVYDVLGRHVTTLVDRVEPAGQHEVRLDAADWASGLYVYVLEAGQQTITKKMLLVK